MELLELNATIREKGLLKARREDPAIDQAVRAVVTQEAGEARIKLPIILGILSSRLQHTAVVEDRPFTSEDEVVVREALLECAPYAHPKVDDHLPKHLSLCGIYETALNRAIGNTDTLPYESRVRGLLHDVGRLILPHRYLLNDGFEGYLFNKIKVRGSFRSGFVETTWLLGIHRMGNRYTMEDISFHSTTQRAHHVGDNFGRFNPDGTLAQPEQLPAIEAAQFERYGNVRWPIEEEGIRTHEGSRKETVMRLLLEEVEWFKDRGVDFDKLEDEVMEEYLSVEYPHQQFVSRFNSTKGIANLI